MCPGVTLASTAAKELPVNPAGFVALSGNDVEPTALDHSWGQENVCPASCHVSCDRDTPQLTSVCHDLRFFAVLAGIQHLMWELRQAQEPAQVFRSHYRPRPHQHRTTMLMQVCNTCHDRIPLGCRSGVYARALVLPM